MLEQQLEALHRTANKKQSSYQQKMKKYYDKNRAPHEFSIGDIVKLYIKDMTKAHKSILPYWDGPYKIIGWPDPKGVTMEVVEYPDGQDIKIVNIQNVEPYRLPHQDW